LQILEGQTTGGRGNTKVHKETAELIQWFLAASLADIYREQLLTPLIAENFHGVEVPDVTVGAVTEEAMLDYLKVDEGLQALGWKLSKRDMGKRYSRIEGEGDDVLAASGGAGGQVQQQPGGGAGASPFSEDWRRFCTEGKNKGLPGPCPEERKGDEENKFPPPGPATPAEAAARLAALPAMPGGGKFMALAPFEHVDEFPFDGKALNDALDKYNVSEESVPLDQLITEQVGVERRGVAAYLDNPGKESTSEEADPRYSDGLIVVRAGGKLYLTDGNHRGTAGVLRGLGQMKAYVVDLPTFSEPRRFCAEGKNKGKPGPCPEDKEVVRRQVHASVQKINAIHGKEVRSLERPSGGTWDDTHRQAVEAQALAILDTAAGGAVPHYLLTGDGATALASHQGASLTVHGAGENVRVETDVLAGQGAGRAALIKPDTPPELADYLIRRVAGLPVTKGQQAQYGTLDPRTRAGRKAQGLSEPRRFCAEGK
jgi:hypothetical protein